MQRKWTTGKRRIKKDGKKKDKEKLSNVHKKKALVNMRHASRKEIRKLQLEILNQIFKLPQ